MGERETYSIASSRDYEVLAVAIQFLAEIIQRAEAGLPRLSASQPRNDESISAFKGNALTQIKYNQ